MKGATRLLLLVLMTGAALAADFRTASVELAGRLYRLELADSPEKRRQGLMYRRSLPAGQGMLFIYDREGDYRIWMKNTRIPLTVLWLDGEARIRHRALLQPCRREPCPVEGSPRFSRFILELPAEDFSRFRPGQRLPALLSIRPSSAGGAATAPPAG